MVSLQDPFPDYLCDPYSCITIIPHTSDVSYSWVYNLMFIFTLLPTIISVYIMLYVLWNGKQISCSQEVQTDTLISSFDSFQDLVSEEEEPL